jgi:hypothetical protein
MNSLVLIPSATHIPPELQGDFGRIPSCMVPYGGLPVLERIVQGYPDDWRVLVAAHAGADSIARYLAHREPGRTSFTDVGPTRSLGETVLRALQAGGGWPGHLVVHFGDTHAPGEVLEGDQFLYACPDDLFRWTTFRLDSGGFPVHLLDKGVEKEGQGQVFIGLFSFADGARFQACLEEAVAAHEAELDPFYRALAAYYRGSARPPTARLTTHWVDLGHLDTYYASRLVHAMGQRAFNEVSVDASRGILTKRSRNTGEFQDEIHWYLSLPPALQYLAPRVFAHSLEPADPWIEMEFYGYPPLSEVYLYARLDRTEWRAIFRVVEQVLADMARHAPPVDEADRVVAALRTMYLDKTVERLGRLRPGDLPRDLAEGPLEVNGRPCLSLKSCLDQLPELLEGSGLLSPAPFGVIHGDFCLSNILFDRRSRAIRLVDPRGRFGAFTMHGDPRYDLAKLSHSFNGGYDFLVHGLFALTRSAPGRLTLRLFEDDGHVEVRNQFNQTFLPEESAFRRVRGIEALLFLSMVPLHADRPRAQEAFLARGLELATAHLGCPSGRLAG